MSTDERPATAAEDPFLRATMAKVFRRILPLIFLASLMSYVDRVNIGYAQLGMGQDLGITAASYGLAAAIFFVAYCVCEVPSNILLGRFGARVWMTRIMVSWGAITVLTGFVQNETQLYIARLLLGVAEAGFFPGMILYMMFWFTGRDRAVAFSALVIAQPVAFLVGGLGSGFVLDHVHWLGLDPWQWVFVLTGIPAVVVGLVILKALPDSPRRAAWLAEKEREAVEKALPTTVEERDAHGLRAQLGALRSPRILHLALINCVTALGFYGFNLFVPLILRQLNPSYSATNIGYLAVLPYGCATLGILAFSIYGSRLTRLRPLNITLTLVSATGVGGVILFRGEPPVALAFLTLMAISCFIFVPSFWAMASTGLSAKHSVVGTAVINSFSALGGFLGPYLVGQGASGDNVTAGLLAPFVALLVGTVLLVAWRPRAAATPVAGEQTLRPREGEAV